MKTRLAVENDVPGITDIYNDAVKRTTGTFDTDPKTIAQQMEWFARHGKSHPVLVVEEAGKVAGWASLSQYSDRCAYARTAEVSVYVAEAARGKGLGGALLDDVLSAGKAAGISEVLARIAEGNETSLKLHFKRGFAEVGRLKRVGVKFGKVLDVHILQKTLALVFALLLAAPAVAGVEDSIRESALSLTKGDVAGARSKAEEAVRSAPRDPRAQEQLARARLAALELEGAETAVSAALAAGETTARLTLRAEIRAGRGDWEGALADAERGTAKSPGSGPARLWAAVAKEGLGRSTAEVTADYRRAAELDAMIADDAYAAIARLTRPAASAAGSRLGPILLLLAFAALGGAAWGARDTSASSPAPAPPRRGPLEVTGRLTPRLALRALSHSTERDQPLALAELLYERLTGAAPFVHETDRTQGRFRAASELEPSLPPGIDAFFARAFDPNPSRRYRRPAELLTAFRAVVDPAIH